MTSLKDYHDKILEPMIEQFARAQIAELLSRRDLFEDMLFYGYKPPTRWERFKYKLNDYKQRCKDIWTIVSGGDVHRDCGD